MSINGAVRSARKGDWRGHDVPNMLAAVGGDADSPAVRLGLRLYFITVLGPGPEQSLRYDLLRQCVARAERILAAHGTEPGDEVVSLLARHRSGHLYVNPYRLTADLFGRRRPTPPDDLLSRVYLLDWTNGRFAPRPPHASAYPAPIWSRKPSWTPCRACWRRRNSHIPLWTTRTTWSSPS